MATTRRWCTLSLRTMLVGITLLSVFFAWQFYYRGQKVRERDRIVAMLAGRNAHVNFRYTILGWKVPESSAWLWRIAFPEPESIRLTANAATPLPAELCEIAQRCAKVEYEGSSGGEDAYLRRCLSSNTKELLVSRNDVSGECLAFVGDCPNLRVVEARFVTLRTKSLAALLNHPRIEQLEIDAEVEDFSLLGELPGPNALQRLDLNLELDWQRRISVTQATLPDDFMKRLPGYDSDSVLNRRPSGEFVWLKQCKQLREISSTFSHYPSFFEAVGRHLGGVERLNLHSSSSEVLETLGTWTKLRFLCVDGHHMNDEKLARLVALCGGLHTLEIDEYSGSKVSLSPQGLRCLQGLPGLKRLRLGKCNLTAEHLEVIAELKQLEELSLEDDRVVDKTVEPLKKLPNLKRISLERTNVSKGMFSKIGGDWDDRRPWRS